MKNILLRSLPSIDSLSQNKKLESYGKSVDYYTFLSCLKEVTSKNRKNILEDTNTYVVSLCNFINTSSYNESEKNHLLSLLSPTNDFSLKENEKFFSESESLKKIIEFKIINEIISLLKEKNLATLQRVINGTGTIIHTNLGRSVFSKEVASQISTLLSSYTNLEYDISTGKRGDRHKNLENLICKVTKAESALVVNNNAAAVLLCLSEFGKNKDVLISRGELVEIGGSFRIPSIMKFSGSNLVEVGTTNRTYISDYEEGITPNTSIVAKVHTSNYSINGYTTNPSVEEIVSLSKKYNLISLEDLGSGNLIDFSNYKMPHEPTIYSSLKAGIDLITFSGDKLLGGCQAGIILGKPHLIEKLKKNQYFRTIRVDKVTISILEEVFKAYLNEESLANALPTLKLITEDPSLVLERTKLLSTLLDDSHIPHEIISSPSTIGGGSMPNAEIPSYAIKFNWKTKANILEKIFRLNSLPIIGKINENNFLLNMKGIFLEDIPIVANEITKIYSKGDFL